MLKSIVNSGNLKDTRKARDLFRKKEYDVLIVFLESVERNEYLDSLYEKAKKQLKTSKKEVVEKEEVQEVKEAINREKTEAKKSWIELFKEKRELRKQGIKTVRKKRRKLKKELPQHIPEDAAEKTDSMNVLLKNMFTHKRKKVVNDSSELLVETLKKKEQIETEQDEAKKAELKAEVEANEMELAKNVQSKLLPQIDRKILPGLDTFVYSMSASELSGDVYDFVATDDNETFFYMGDATGHGTAAGLVMTMISCLAHSIFQRNNNLKDALVTLNREAKPKLQANMFVTMLMCKWHKVLREFRVAGAGHEEILHYHAKEKKVTRVVAGGIAVGMMADMSKIVKETHIKLEHDDVLMFLTDGLTEAWDEKKENMYGLEKIEEKLVKLAGKMSSEDMGKQILDDIFKFQGDGEKTDDMTLMIFKRQVSQDEARLKEDYEKEILEEEVLKDELVMGNNSEKFSPDLQRTQDDFVRKSISLAKIHVQQEHYHLAEEVVEKGLRIAPENQHLKKLKKEVEEYIQDAEIGGFFEVLKRSILTAIYKFANKKTLTQQRNNLLSKLHKEAEHALSLGDRQTFSNIMSQVHDIAPNSKEYKNLKKLQSAGGKKSNVLQSIFQLRGAKKEDRFHEEIHAPQETEMSATEVLEMKKGMVSFKKDLESVSEKVESFLGEEGVKDSSYAPSADLDKDDILGLKRLLSLKDGGGAKAGAAQPQKKEEPSGEMKWEKGGALEKRRKSYNKFMSVISPMNKSDLFSFIEKLSAFVRAKIPIQTSIEIMQEQAENDGYVYVLDEINKELDKGKLLSQAIEKFPQHFPEMLQFLISAGEKSGALSLILSDLADQMKEQQIVSSRIRGALIYPSVIITASLGIIVGMMWFIVPRLTKIYLETGVELPAITQFIVNTSNYIQTNYLFIIFSIIAFIVGIIFFAKTPVGKRIFHKVYLYLPVVRMVSRGNNTMLFLSNLGILLENGVQLAESLKVVAKITPNVYYKDEIINIRERMISQGVPLSEAMGIKESFGKRSGLFPSEVLQAIAIGEQTGELSDMLKSSGVMFKERIKNLVKGFSEILEPLIMIFVGLVVATILMAIMFPLFKIGKVLRKQ